MTIAGRQRNSKLSYGKFSYDSTGFYFEKPGSKAAESVNSLAKTACLWYFKTVACYSTAECCAHCA
jgi:hypothetical protein